MFFKCSNTCTGSHGLVHNYTAATLTNFNNTGIAPIVPLCVCALRQELWMFFKCDTSQTSALGVMD